MHSMCTCFIIHALWMDEVYEYTSMCVLKPLPNWSSNQLSGRIVECWTRNRDSLGSNPPFPTVSKFGQFRSLH